MNGLKRKRRADDWYAIASIDHKLVGMGGWADGIGEATHGEREQELGKGVDSGISLSLAQERVMVRADCLLPKSWAKSK